jgi:hypothetical protein
MGCSEVFPERPLGTRLTRVFAAVATVITPGAVAFAVTMARVSWAITTPGPAVDELGDVTAAAIAGVPDSTSPTTAQVTAVIVLTCMTYSLVVRIQGMGSASAR